MPTAAAQLFLTQRGGRALKSAPPAPPSGFVPSGALWDNALAVYTATGGTGNVWRMDAGAMRQSNNLGDGVTAGQKVGFIHDWLGPGNNARALTAEGDQRGVFATVEGVTGVAFPGTQNTNDNEYMFAPPVNTSVGTAIFVGRLTDNTNARQTLWESGIWRLDGRFDALGPAVRVGGNVWHEFGLTSMVDRWTCFVIQWSQPAGFIRIWRDGAAGWATHNVGQWLTGTPSLLNRNNFQFNDTPTAPFGAPATSIHKAAIWINQLLPDAAPIQALVNLAIDGTSISATVPAISPGGGGDPAPEELPSPLSTIQVANQTQLNNAVAAADPGDHVVMATGTYNLPNLTRSGTAANPIIYRAATNQAVTLSGLGNVTGHYNRVWGCLMGVQNFGDLVGTDFWAIRCRWTGGTGRKMQFKAPRAHVWYCEIGNSAGQAIIYDTGANVGGSGVMGIEGHVKGCWFHDYAMGSEFGNAHEPIMIGRSDQRTFVVSNTLVEATLFENCNIGGQEDETLGIKTSFVIVRNCTFRNTRFLAIRHGTNHLIDRCVAVDCGTVGGFTIRDANTIVQNCRAQNSRTAIYAGNLKPTDNGGGQWWTVDVNTLNPKVRWPATYNLKVYNHDAIQIAPIIGDKYTPDFSPLCPADGITWLGNRGLNPTLRSNPTGYWANVNPSGEWGNAAPVAYVPPSALSTQQVGVFA